MLEALLIYLDDKSPTNEVLFSFFNGKYNGQHLLFMTDNDSPVGPIFLIMKAIGCLFCYRTAPILVLEASVSTSKGKV